MSVDVSGRLYIAVSHPFLNVLEGKTIVQQQACAAMAQLMKAPASGGTAFDRAKAARKRARAAPATHFIAGSRQNDCTRCAKKYPPFFVAAFDLTFVYVRLAAAPVGVQFFLQRLLYWLRSSG